MNCEHYGLLGATPEFCARNHHRALTNDPARDHCMKCETGLRHFAELSESLNLKTYGGFGECRQKCPNPECGRRTIGRICPLCGYDRMLKKRGQRPIFRPSKGKGSSIWSTHYELPEAPIDDIPPLSPEELAISQERIFQGLEGILGR